MFTVPNLPTDNLYKFYALSGLITTLFIITSIGYVILGIDRDIDELGKSVDLLELDSQFLSDDIARYYSKSDEISDSLDEYEHQTDTVLIGSANRYSELKELLKRIENDPNYRAYLEFSYKHWFYIFPIRKDYEESKILVQQIFDAERKLAVKRTEISANKDIIDGKFNELMIFAILGTVLCFFTIKLSKNGFKQWKKNVQTPMDRKLEIELKLLEIELGKIRQIVVTEPPVEPEDSNSES